MDVHSWAKKINGGGHAKAAAGWIKAPMEQAKEAVLELGEDSIKQAKNSLSSLLILTIFLAWAMFAGACIGVGQMMSQMGLAIIKIVWFRVNLSYRKKDLSDG